MCSYKRIQLLCIVWLVYVRYTSEKNVSVIQIPGNVTVKQNNSGQGNSSHLHSDPTIEAFEACGLIKRCFSRFADKDTDKNCIEDRSCDMIFAYGKGLGESLNEGEATFEIYAVARGWAAVGISLDDGMGDDYVMECTKEGNVVNMYNSWNTKIDGKDTNIRLRGNQSLKYNIRRMKMLYYDDKLYCKFYIKTKFSKIDTNGIKHEYDLNQPYYYIMAFSNALPEYYGEGKGNIGGHSAQGAVSERLKQPVTAAEHFSPLPYQTTYLRVHGIFMIFCWLFFMSLSIFVGRYLKETLTRIKVWSMELWYFTHALTATLAFPCIIASIVYQIQATNAWRNLFHSNFHTYSGIVCLCLFITELATGLFATKSVEGHTNMLNQFHVIVGHMTYALSFINMAFAERVAYGFLACNFSTYVLAWSALYSLIHFLMTYHKCWGHFVLGRGYLSAGITEHGTAQTLELEALATQGHSRSRTSVRRSRKTLGEENQVGGRGENIVIEAPGRYFRLWALAMFTIITTVYTYWANRKLLTHPQHCYSFRELKALENGFN